jgi:hypothetical protein
MNSIKILYKDQPVSVLDKESLFIPRFITNIHTLRAKCNVLMLEEVGHTITDVL